MDVPLAICFSLGEALRSGDAECFLERYDVLLETLHHNIQLATAKECARQISELSKAEFTLLQKTALDHPGTTNGEYTHISTEESVVVQLSTLLEELAVEDVESTEATTKLFTDVSSSQLTEELVQSDPHKEKALSVNGVQSLSQVETPLYCLEKNSFVSEDDAPLHRTSPSEPVGENLPTNQEILNSINSTHSTSTVRRTSSPKVCRSVKQKPPTPTADHCTALKPLKDRTHSNQTGRGSYRGWRGRWKRGNRGKGSRHTGMVVRDFPHPPPVTYNHSEVASFLLKGWQTAQRELMATH